MTAGREVRDRWGSATRWAPWVARTAMALKASTAAALAWLIVLPFGAGGPDYAYYAPLGAVIAVSATVARSLRRSVQTVASIMVGSGLSALAVWLLPGPGVVLLALLVAAGVLLSAVPWLGAGGQWVPLASIFVLVVDDSARADYVASYVGLTAFGAVVGIGMNLVLPPLPLRSTQRAVEELRTTLADQLDELATGLRGEELPEPAEWSRRRRSVGPRRLRAQQLVDEAAEARRGNWRARRWTVGMDRQERYGHALERLALLVEDLTLTVVGHEHAEPSRPTIAPGLRPCVADAFGESATLLRSAGAGGADGHAVRAVERSVARLEDRALGLGHEAGDIFVAGMIVTVLRDITEAVRPAEDGS